MKKEDAIHDLEALIDFFQEECNAVPICLNYCLKILKGETHDESLS